MTQTRVHNYKQEDSTWLFNQKYNGIIQPALYRGFDCVPTADMVLNLGHVATAFEAVEENLTLVNYGIWVTRQGGVIFEDGVIQLPISANASGNPRIDTIVGQHEYTAVSGGSPAVYAVVEGTPGAVPVAPAPNIPAKQVVLGYLYVPDGTTALTDAGVAYTRAENPFLGNRNPNFAYRDQANTFTGLQTINELSLSAWTEAVYTLATELVTAPGGKTLLFVTPTGDGYVKDIDATAPEGTVIAIRFDAAARIRLTGNILFAVPAGITTLDVGAGDVVTFIGNGAAWQVVSVQNTYATANNRANKFTATQSLGQGALIIVPANSALDITGGNSFDVGYITEGNIESIQAVAIGTIITLRLTDSSLVLVHDYPTIPGGYKPIYVDDDGKDFGTIFNTVVQLIEEGTQWRVVWHNGLRRTDNLWTAFTLEADYVGGTLTIPNPGYRPKAEMTQLRGDVRWVGGVAHDPNIHFATLPVGYRPSSNKRFMVMGSNNDTGNNINGFEPSWLVINTDGKCYINTNSAVTSVCLDGVEFERY